jgi:hypothetical protein
VYKEIVYGDSLMPRYGLLYVVVVCFFKEPSWSVVVVEEVVVEAGGLDSSTTGAGLTSL